MVFKNELPKKRFSLSYKVEIFFDGEVARPAEVAEVLPHERGGFEKSIENTCCCDSLPGMFRVPLQTDTDHIVPSNIIKCFATDSYMAMGQN